jgi:hypothetical protein
MIALLLFLQVATAQAPFTVQMGSKVTPDTVTVGQRFILLLKVRAPAGAEMQFPMAVDSSVSQKPTAPQIIGTPLVDSVADATGTTRTAAYRFTAWDIGPQPLGLGNIAVTVNGQTVYVSLANQSVFVRSVLPADTTQRIPKPLRPPIVLLPFNWLPWLLLLAAIAAALPGLVALAMVPAASRRNRCLHSRKPSGNSRASKAMKLIESGEPERHVALMTDVMRNYLAARVEGVQISQTTKELLTGASSVRSHAAGLDQILDRADLIKFARQQVSADDARAMGGHARSIVRSVEDHFIALEKEKVEKPTATETAEKRAA